MVRTCARGPSGRGYARPLSQVCELALSLASLFEEFDPVPYVSLLIAALMAHPIFLCLRYVRQNTAIRAAISKNHKRGSLN